MPARAGEDAGWVSHADERGRGECAGSGEESVEDVVDAAVGGTAEKDALLTSDQLLHQLHHRTRLPPSPAVRG